MTAAGDITYLGNRQAEGVLNANNPYVPGAWTVTFDPQVLKLPARFDIYHMTLNGPTGSRMKVYIDTTFYSNVVRGDINDWDPTQLLPMAPGQTLYFHWNVVTGSRPLGVIFCRRPLL